MGDGGWAAAEVLAEPTRRRVYDLVRELPGAVTREQVADVAGISRRLAAFHLDRLAEAGLLTVDFARPEGRRGPGAGRPAKRYVPSAIEVDVTVPARRYSLVARILASAIARSPEDAAAVARDIGREEGRTIGAVGRGGGRPRRKDAMSMACSALHDIGYEPIEGDRQVVRLRNCPFHEVADVARELVCGVNEQVVCGVLEGLDVDQHVTARLDGDAPPDCCVTLSPRT